MRRMFVLSLMLALGGAVLLVGAASSARPTCVVSNERTGVGSLSLQAAIDAAAANDTLVVKGTCAGSSTIDRNLTLRGVSNKPFGTATLDGGGLGRVLRVGVGITVSISNLTLTRGSSVVGGAILNDGVVTIRGSTLSRNTTTQSGGAIFNDPGATIALIDSTVSGNTELNAGGGILNQEGLVTLTKSAVRGNTAGSAATTGYGGGIWNDGSVTLIDSAVTGNTATGNGGGIYNFGTVTLSGTSAVVGNTPNDCAGFPGC